MKTVLLIFIKNMSIGKVKTRLSNTIGDANAMKIYQHLLTHTAEATLDIELDRVVLYNEFIPTADSWPSSKFEKGLQVGDHFGQKVINALQHYFEIEDYHQVLILQPDCPKLTPMILRKAIKELNNQNDVVIGPTSDNGYYLIGFNKNFPQVYEDSTYDNCTKLDFIINNLKANEIKFGLADELQDIDQESDLGDWKKLIE
jgi:rSAM/selenodomain-associated transferase 1